MNDVIVETLRTLVTAAASGLGGAWLGLRKARAEAGKIDAEAEATISGEALEHVRELREELAEMRARLDMSDMRYAELYTKHLELQAQIGRLERAIEDRDASLRRLTTERNAAREEVARLRREGAEYQRHITELETEVAQLRQRIEELERGRGNGHVT